MRIFDITLPISEKLAVWPGDPLVQVQAVSTLAAGEAAVSRISLSSHAGTHVDPPAHFVAGGLTVERLSLDVLVGPAWVARLAGLEPISGSDLAAAQIPAGTQRLLLCTANSDGPAERVAFDAHFVGLTADAARWLLAAGVQLVGIDGPSIEPFDAAGDPVHRLLLGAGIIVVENLALRHIEPGPYELFCLPLPIVGGDGAPARAILMQGRS